MPDFRSNLEKTMRADSFPDDKSLQFTIEDIVAQEVGLDKETKPVVYFKEDTRGFVLNKTNYTVLTKAHASPNTDDWIGALVEIWKDPSITFSGKAVGGLRVKVVKKAAGKAGVKA